jgi:hypothetical protein
MARLECRVYVAAPGATATGGQFFTAMKAGGY